jgi:amino acid transporter
MKWLVIPPLRQAVRRQGTPCRRFGLLDGMILVAGVAVGIALSRTRLFYWEEMELGLTSSWLMLQVFDVASYVLVVMSFLMLVLRLRRPRPTLRRVARQPGFAACLVAVLLDIGAVYTFVLYRASAWDGIGDLEGLLDLSTLNVLRPEPQTAFAIAAIWLIFALGRIGRPEPGWIDRAGRVAGWGWIAWGVGSLYLDFYFE